MPRYLALDFLSQALVQRRSQLESMLIPPPYHIEIVDIYIHNGQSSHSSYYSPWKDLEYSNDAMFVSSLETIESELKFLVDQYSPLVPDTLDDFVTVSDDDVEVSSDTDLFSLSQDIDSAMRDLTDQCEGNSCTRRVGSEEYTMDEVVNWEMIVDQDSMGAHILETPESPGRVDILLTLVPDVDDLSGRLKPKLIQDPFIASNGLPYSYEDMFRSDSALDASSSQGSRHDRETPKLFTEDFQSEPLQNDHDTDIDPLFELNIPHTIDEGGPLSLLDDCDEVELPQISTDGSPLDGDVLKRESSKDLELLVGEEAKVTQEHIPDFSPHTEQAGKGVLDFPTLNNQDVSNDSDDSGIGHALLESPLLPQTRPSLSPSIERQLAKLEPIPMSPDKKIVFLSPETERRLIKDLWEGDKVFDTILAHTLPYPDIGDGISAVLSVNMVSELLTLFGIKVLKMDGDSELDLPWDPLADCCGEMERAQQSLVTKQPTFESVLASETTIKHLDNEKNIERETFMKDESVDDVVELPLSLTFDEYSTCGVENGSVMLGSADIAGFNEFQPPHHSSHSSHPHSSHPHVHRKDAAWNLLLQSSSALTNTSNVSGNSIKAPLISSSSNRDPVLSSSSIKDPPMLGYTHYKPPIGSTDQPKTFEMFTRGRESGNLDSFLLLRSNLSSGGIKRGRSEIKEQMTVGEPARKRSIENAGNDTLMELELVERTATPTFLDVCLSGDYLTTISKLDQFATDLSIELQDYGFRMSKRNIHEIPIESVKFFLKQQQKALEDNHSQTNTDAVVRSCQLAASLYLSCSVVKALFHCSLGAGLVKFTSLSEKYQDLIKDKLSPVKKELLSLQLSSRESGGHPKLHELVRVVGTWRDKERESRKEKAVIVLNTEFPTVSGEILDNLQSIPGLKCCVFSFVPHSSPDPLYLKAVEERFQLYDCLLVPQSSLSSHESFPWERVSLLVEYEQLERPLFNPSLDEGNRAEQRSYGPTVADRLCLKKYISLRTVQDISTTVGTNQSTCGGVHSEDLSLVQYTLIASERITANTQLLQLLETRHNTLIVERDFHTLYQRHNSKCFAYADLIIDHCTGILLRPLSTLSTEQGVRALINTVTALSFQYERCWVLLYTEDTNSYPYGGTIPANLARLHASIAHYCPKLDEYSVKVLTMAGLEQVAHWVRRVAEETHVNCKGVSRKEWTDRNWIYSEMSEGERILLSFPCLNSFSALLMLKEASLSDILSMSLSHLMSCSPWLSHKVAKMFNSMCTSSAIPEIGEAQSSFLPNVEATSYESIPNSNTMLSSPQASGHFPVSNSSDIDTLQYTDNSDQCFTTQGTVGLMESDSVNLISDQSKFERSPSFDQTFGNAQESVITLNDSLEDEFDHQLSNGKNTLFLKDYDNPFSEEDYRQDVVDLTSPVCDPGSSTTRNCGLHYNQLVTAHEPRRDYNQLVTAHEPRRDYNQLVTAHEPRRDYNQLVTAHEPRRDYNQLVTEQEPQQKTSKTMFTFERQDHSNSANPWSLFKKNTTGKEVRANTPNNSYFEKAHSETRSKSSAMRLLSSSRDIGKPPSQKQIKEAVLENINPSSSNPIFANRFATEYNMYPTNSRFISSSAVKSNSFSQVRTPIKSLDLGFETRNSRKVYLHSNDRAIGSRPDNSNHHEQMSHVGGARSMPFMNDTFFGRERSGFPFSKDSVVPSHHFMSPPSTKDTSLFDSPGGSIKLSPTRTRHLTCQKDPARTDGQTKLVMF